MSIFNKLIKETENQKIESRELELYKKLLTSFKNNDKEQYLKVCKETSLLKEYEELYDIIYEKNMISRMNFITPEKTDGKMTKHKKRKKGKIVDPIEPDLTKKDDNDANEIVKKIINKYNYRNQFDLNYETIIDNIEKELIEKYRDKFMKKFSNFPKIKKTDEKMEKGVNKAIKRGKRKAKDMEEIVKKYKYYYKEIIEKFKTDKQELNIIRYSKPMRRLIDEILASMIKIEDVNKDYIIKYIEDNKDNKKYYLQMIENYWLKNNLYFEYLLKQRKNEIIHGKKRLDKQEMLTFYYQRINELKNKTYL